MYLEGGYHSVVAIGVLDYGYEIFCYVLNDPESVAITVGGSRIFDELIDHAYA